MATQVATTFLAKVFNWMAVGLALTAGLAFAVANSATAQQLIYGNRLVFYALIFGELGMVLYLSARIEKISATAATALFLLNSALNGVTMAAVLLMYTAASVATTFAVAGGMFAAMAVYGSVTKNVRLLLDEPSHLLPLGRCCTRACSRLWILRLGANSRRRTRRQSSPSTFRTYEQ